MLYPLWLEESSSHPREFILEKDRLNQTCNRYAVDVHGNFFLSSTEKSEMFNKGNKSFSTYCFYRCFLEAKTGESLINPDKKRSRLLAGHKPICWASSTGSAAILGCQVFTAPIIFRPIVRSVTWNENCQVPNDHRNIHPHDKISTDFVGTFFYFPNDPGG